MKKEEEKKKKKRKKKKKTLASDVLKIVRVTLKSLTTDQCIDLFQTDFFYMGIFGREEVQDNCEATNRFYSGLNLPISDAVFVNHGMDPWRNVSAVRYPPNTRNIEIINVKGEFSMRRRRKIVIGDQLHRKSSDFYQCVSDFLLCIYQGVSAIF